MPRSAKHPCPHPGCGALVDYSARYCPAHQPDKTAQRVYDQQKRPEAKFYHGARWQRLRRWFLRLHPLCVSCLAMGRIEPARIVDHVKEIRDGGDRYDPDNLQALCFACHNLKTTSEKKIRKREGG